MKSGNRYPLLDRLLDRVVESATGCWLWTGIMTTDGYGLFVVYSTDEAGVRSRVGHGAHRLMYMELIADPGSLTLDHLCRVRHCANPWHLEPVTRGENTLRGQGPTAVNARKTHCVHGHPLTPDNIYPTAQGQRHCRTCALRRAAEHKKRRKAA